MEKDRFSHLPKIEIEGQWYKAVCGTYYCEGCAMWSGHSCRLNPEGVTISGEPCAYGYILKETEPEPEPEPEKRAGTFNIQGKTCTVESSEKQCDGCAFEYLGGGCMLVQSCGLRPYKIYRQVGHKEQEKQEDLTNPLYYQSYPVETIDMIDMMVRIFGKEAVRQHCLCTAFKYRMRLGRKGADGKTVEVAPYDVIQKDMAKEQWYLNKAKELEA